MFMQKRQAASAGKLQTHVARQWADEHLYKARCNYLALLWCCAPLLGKRKHLASYDSWGRQTRSAGALKAGPVPTDLCGGWGCARRRHPAGGGAHEKK